MNAVDMGRIVMMFPSEEHISELKEKGIDLLNELSRIVYDNVKKIQADELVGRMDMFVTKEQTEELEKNGINAAENFARVFKEEFEKKTKNEE